VRIALLRKLRDIAKIINKSRMMVLICL
jgi:hypothetical protein